ncbi:MAG: isopentenyl phosphate kinase family protein [Candidatus Thorarchaeota archaeon]|nr:isopentenyl phosphate kinase family protein [Candidatus Thorarchaeota archaeon]
MRKLTLLKLGGSVITKKEVSPPVINTENVSRIAREIKLYHNPLLIVLGGGAHGHQAAHRYGFGDPNTPFSKLVSGIPSIRHNMSVLSLGIESILKSNDIASVVISPFSSVTLNDGEIESFPLDAIRRTLDANHTVITHGDVCYDDVRGASILSGDTILAYLTVQLDIERVLVGTNVDGILDANPNDNADAQIISVINEKNRDEVLGITGPSGSTDVTGGMKRKISDLLTISELGIEVIIFNLTIPSRLAALLQGEQITCTRITA